MIKLLLRSDLSEWAWTKGASRDTSQGLSEADGRDKAS